MAGKNKKPMGELETRIYPVELRAESDGEIGRISGTPIVYDSITDLGWFDEMIVSGALDMADLSDVRLCLNHDTSFVYARSRRNNPRSTMRLNVQPHGLDIEADLAIGKSPKAADYYTAIERRDITGMSFMFRIDAEEWENLESDHPLRKITRISSVVEVSAVTFPAYEATTVDISARSKEALESARAAVETARQQARRGDEGRELELLKLKLTLA